MSYHSKKRYRSKETPDGLGNKRDHKSHLQVHEDGMTRTSRRSTTMPVTTELALG